MNILCDVEETQILSIKNTTVKLPFVEIISGPFFIHDLLPGL